MRERETRSRRVRRPILAACAALLAPAAGPAVAFEPGAYELLGFFERVCVYEAPDFHAVPRKLVGVGFAVSEAAPGAYEARSRRSAYTVYVRPAAERGGFARCALSVEGVSRAAARRVLEEFVYDSYDGAVAEEPDGAGGVQYRVLIAEPSLVFAAFGDARGAALAVAVAPAE